MPKVSENLKRQKDLKKNKSDNNYGFQVNFKKVKHI